MRSQFIALFLILIVLFTGCTSAESARTSSTTLTVFAAASLTDAFTEMATEFEANNPHVKIVLNFAGSQTLRLQIEQGARADVFASANVSHMQTLVNAGLMQMPTIFTQNQLVVILPASNPAKIQTLADLTRPGTKLILAGEVVPAGKYAHQLLTQLGNDPQFTPDFAVRVLSNLVSEEDSVKGVVAKVRLGEADAGIVYASDVTPLVAPDLLTLAIPLERNITADYPLTVSTSSAAPELANQFIEFVLSVRGQTLLAEHGFRPTQTQAIGQNQ